jgi:hypothetical protein
MTAIRQKQRTPGSRRNPKPADEPKGIHRIMQKWEYLFEQTETVKEVDDILVKAGADGWELVSVTHIPFTKYTGGGNLPTINVPSTYWNFFFKRPL